MYAIRSYYDLTIDIRENKIYYIGDIVLNWTIDKEKDATNYNGGGAVGGVAGAIADSKKPGEFIKVDIADNYDETTKYFVSKFPDSQTIEKELIVITSYSIHYTKLYELCCYC